MRPIDANTLKAEFTGNFNDGYYTVAEIKAHIDTAPTVSTVPLEPLAKWIVENLDPRIYCESCTYGPDSNECACGSCPSMSEKQVKEALEKWMEEQDAAD